MTETLDAIRKTIAIILLCIACYRYFKRDEVPDNFIVLAILLGLL